MRLRIAALSMAASFLVFASGCKEKPVVDREEARRLVQSLSSDSASTREKAERRLALSDPDMIRPALGHLFDNVERSSPNARRVAVRLLSETSDRDLTRITLNALSDPSLDVRRAAVKGAVGHGNPYNRQFLELAAENEQDPALKAEIVAAMTTELPASERKWYRYTLAFPLTDEQCALAARGLAAFKDPQDVPVLIETFGKQSGALPRYEIVLALATIGGEKAADHVLLQVTSDDPYVRAAAAMAESTLRDPRAVAPLGVVLTEDSVADNRVSAARALAAIGGAEAAAAVKAACVDPAAPVKVKYACDAAARELAAPKTPRTSTQPG